ncbi:helix-turn-helix domain-containing protein [Stenotrophomonas maltophilia group sp. CASM26]|uniref:helix-turn-helix domain-containing protein n=1 Tax=Stenotrophomonas maltophilia group sp. CASM26 TaxID=3111514 RepID=UPI003BF926CA
MQFAIIANDLYRGFGSGYAVASCRPTMQPKSPATLFGRRLRAARVAAGLTQADLGRVLGLDDQNTGAPRVSRYETGRHEPDQETMAKIAEALGLPVAYFHATSDTLAKIILMVGRLPPDEQARISDLIEQWIEKK